MLSFKCQLFPVYLKVMFGVPPDLFSIKPIFFRVKSPPINIPCQVAHTLARLYCGIVQYKVSNITRQMPREKYIRG